MAEGRSCGEVGRAYRSERGTAIRDEPARASEGWASAVAGVEKEMRRRRDLRGLLGPCCQIFVGEIAVTSDMFEMTDQKSV